MFSKPSQKLALADFLRILFLHSTSIKSYPASIADVLEENPEYSFVMRGEVHLECHAGPEFRSIRFRCDQHAIRVGEAGIRADRVNGTVEGIVLVRQVGIIL